MQLRSSVRLFLFAGHAIMVLMRKPNPSFALLLLLSACSSEDRRAGGTTADEARALEDAAQMLEERELAPGSVPSGAAATPSPGAKPDG